MTATARDVVEAAKNISNYFGNMSGRGNTRKTRLRSWATFERQTGYPHLWEKEMISAKNKYYIATTASVQKLREDTAALIISNDAVLCYVEFQEYPPYLLGERRVRSQVHKTIIHRGCIFPV